MNSLEAQIFTVKVKEVNSKLYSINQGGCGVFAINLSKKLNSLGIDNKIVILDYYFLIEKHKDSIKQKGRLSRNDSKPSHVMVKVGRYYIDSTGSYTNRELKDTRWGEYSQLFVTCDQIRGMVNTTYGWNNTFRRTKTNIQLIKKYIDTACEDVHLYRIRSASSKPAHKKIAKKILQCLKF